MNDPRDDESPLHATTTESSVQSPRSLTIPPPAATLEERVAAAIVQPDAAAAPPPPVAVKPFEVWAKAKKTEAHWLNAARVTNHWAIGRELTEATYDAAIDAVQKVELR